jgi:hypothetical protein
MMIELESDRLHEVATIIRDTDHGTLLRPSLEAVNDNKLADSPDSSVDSVDGVGKTNKQKSQVKYGCGPDDTAKISRDEDGKAYVGIHDHSWRALSASHAAREVLSVRNRTSGRSFNPWRERPQARITPLGCEAGWRAP